MNDKNKADSGKLRLTLVPLQIIREIARVRMYGLEKYPETGRDGWREIGTERIKDAMCRHLLAYLDDPDGIDVESGLPHLSHLACNIAFLCEMEINEPKDESTHMSVDDFQKLNTFEITFENCKVERG